jgi:hypothetical protein
VGIEAAAAESNYWVLNGDQQGRSYMEARGGPGPPKPQNFPLKKKKFPKKKKKK